MRRDRKPVLTSPWKIGVLVALLLLVTNSAVAYYMVAEYGIDLDWIDSGSGMWGIDSYGFFKETFPLAASVLICSLIAYFVIASAVRRYRYYIDSGQDYRKMISLADSIDDLTNPSQIASLSDYPEFQAILRNYGDQIREISRQINENYEMLDNTELEKELEALLAGEPVTESESEKRWWTGTIKKLSERMSASDGELEKLRQDNEETKKHINGTALSLGRISETLEEVRSGLGEIGNIVDTLEERAVETDAEGAEQDGGSLEVAEALEDIDMQLKRLVQGGSAMSDFSETTNGLALNIALLAAKGRVGEKDLAGFAEKARTTSEKFKKLSAAVQSLAGKLQSDFEMVRAGWSARADQTASGKKSDIAGLTEKLETQVENISVKLEKAASDTGSAAAILKSVTSGQTDDLGKTSSGAGEPSGIAEEGTAKESGSDELEILRSDEFAGAAGEEWDPSVTDEITVEDASAGEKQKAEESDTASVADIDFSPGSAEVDFANETAGKEEIEPENAESGITDEIDFSDLSGAEGSDKDFEDSDVDPAAVMTEGQEEDSDRMWDSLNISGDGNEGEEIGIEFKDMKEAEEIKEKPLREKAEAESGTDAEEEEYVIDPQSVNGVEAAYDEFLDRSVNQQKETTQAAGNEEDEDDPIIDLYDLGAVEVSNADMIQ